MLTSLSRARKFLCMAAGVFLLAAGSAPAVARDMATIKASGALVVAVPAVQAPPFFFEEKGELKGLDIELARSIAEELGVRVVFKRDARNFNDAVSLVAQGRADIAAAKLSRTLARAQNVLFSDPYIVLPHALLVNRLRFAELAGRKSVTETLQQFTGVIGVIAQSSYVGFAKSNFPRARVVEFDSWKAAVDAVFAGKITAAYRDAFEIKRIFKTRPDLALSLRSVIIDDITDTIGIAVGADNYHLHSFVNLFLHQKGIQYSAGQILERYGEQLK